MGAHYFTFSITQGAYEQAQIAGLIELSRIFGKHLPDDGVLGAFFIEEPPYYRKRNIGSYHLAKRLKKSNINLLGMMRLGMTRIFLQQSQ